MNSPCQQCSGLMMVVACDALVFMMITSNALVFMMIAMASITQVHDLASEVCDRMMLFMAQVHDPVNAVCNRMMLLIAHDFGI